MQPCFYGANPIPKQGIGEKASKPGYHLQVLLPSSSTSWKSPQKIEVPSPSTTPLMQPCLMSCRSILVAHSGRRAGVKTLREDMLGCHALVWRCFAGQAAWWEGWGRRWSEGKLVGTQGQGVRASKREVEMEQPLEASSLPFTNDFRIALKLAKCLQLAKGLYVGQDCSLTGKITLYSTSFLCILQNQSVFVKIVVYSRRLLCLLSALYIGQDCTILEKIALYLVKTLYIQQD